MTSAEALIIGGGPAGAALAIQLAGAGRKVLLVEKKAGPHHKVCGEFLSREAIRYLSRIGVDAAALGAEPISALRLVCRNAVIESDLPFPALSLSRYRLDEFLLLRAEQTGAKILRGCSVESLHEQQDGWHADLSTGESLSSETTFLATGKHDLRGWRRPPGSQNDLIAFKMHWRLTASHTAERKGHVELILFPGGYCGLQPVEDGIVNLCLLVRRKTFQELGSWTQLLESIKGNSSHLEKLLRGAVPLWPQPLSVSSIPYGHVHKQVDNLWRLGDQMAVIGSFSGDGMSIALHSAALAASVYLSGGTAEIFHHRIRRSVSKQVALATKISQAFVGSAGQHLIARGARLWPGALQTMAAATRIPEWALVTTL